MSDSKLPKLGTTADIMEWVWLLDTDQYRGKDPDTAAYLARAVRIAQAWDESVNRYDDAQIMEHLNEAAKKEPV